MNRTGRAGSHSERKSRNATLKHPTHGSETSKKRANRSFKNLESSCRIHKRAKRRSEQSRLQYGKVHDAGTKVDGGSGTFVHNAGGSIHYW